MTSREVQIKLRESGDYSLLWYQIDRKGWGKGERKKEKQREELGRKKQDESEVLRAREW